MTDLFPNIDEFGRGSTTCRGTMTGCAVCATANVLLRYGKPIPHLPDGTPDMITLGRRMGNRHRSVENVRHGKSLEGFCTGGTNWCTYCAYLELQSAGLPVLHRQLSWVEIEAQLENEHPVVLPGHYGAINIVPESSYSAIQPARGRSDSTFTLDHMLVAWRIDSRYASGEIRAFTVSDSDFGSPSRPTVPPHSVITRSALRAFWLYRKWSVAFVNAKPPAIVAPPMAWWGREVPDSFTAAYTADKVAAKLRAVGIAHWGTAINLADLAAGLKKRGIPYGTQVDLADLRHLMKAGVGA